MSVPTLQHSVPRQSRRLPLHVLSSCIIGALLASACATPGPAPAIAISAAGEAITTAEKNRQPDFASPDLAEARTRLEAARLAAADQQPLLATRLAEESRVDAELAAARSEVAKARLVNQQIQTGNTTLSRELNRTTGDPK